MRMFILFIKSLIALLLLVAASSSAFAQTTFPRSRIAGFQTLYSGEKGKSFGDGGSGIGGEIENITDMSIVAFYLKFRLTQATGEQGFYDNTTLVNSAYTYYQGEGELGFYLFPLERSKTGLNVYLGAGGVAGYNYISLDKSLTFTQLQSSDQAGSFGYAVSVGAEWIFKTNVKSWSLNTNFSYRVENAKLLGQSAFNLSGLQLSLGLGF